MTHAMNMKKNTVAITPVVIEATIPSVWFHLLLLADAALAFSIGAWIYKKYNTRFLYYL